MQRVREPSVTAVSPQTEFSSSSFEINFWGLRSKSRRTAKRLRLNRQHLARFEERELVFANLNVGEAENKGLIPDHRFIIRPKKFLMRVEKLITSPSRPRRTMRPECLQPARLRSSHNVKLQAIRCL